MEQQLSDRTRVSSGGMRKCGEKGNIRRGREAFFNRLKALRRGEKGIGGGRGKKISFRGHYLIQKALHLERSGLLGTDSFFTAGIIDSKGRKVKLPIAGGHRTLTLFFSYDSHLAQLKGDAPFVPFSSRLPRGGNDFKEKSALNNFVPRNCGILLGEQT